MKRNTFKQKTNPVTKIFYKKRTYSEIIILLQEVFGIFGVKASKILDV